MLNIRQIAEAAGVSAATVSRVLNGSTNVHPKTREKVRAILREQRYIPNLLGPALLKGQTKTVAFIIPDITNTFFTEIASAFQNTVQAAGKTVIVGNTNENVRTEQQIISSVLGHRVDGIALAPVGRDSYESITLIQHYNTPLVLLDREVENVEGVSVVRGDNVHGTRLLTEHLLSSGYRRLAVITGPEGVSTADERLEAFLASCREAGHDVLPEHIVRSQLNVDEGRNAALRLLQTDPRPDAVVATNNFLALGCVQAARTLGLAIPDDLGVVSFDGFANSLGIEPFLTAVEQPTREMGELAAKILLGKMPGDKAPQGENGNDDASCGAKAEGAPAMHRYLFKPVLSVHASSRRHHPAN